MINQTAKLPQKEALVEFKLNLLFGATGVEDKMQEGDKLETAISIGLSCKLLCANMQQIIINGTSEVECRNLLAYARDKFGVRSSSGEHQNLKHKTNAKHGDLDIPNDTKSSSMPKWNLGKEEKKHYSIGTHN